MAYSPFTSNKSKFNKWLKYFMFLLKLLLLKSYWEESKCFVFLICNQINLFFKNLCVNSNSEKLRGHKLGAVMSHIYLLLMTVHLSTLQNVELNLCFDLLSSVYIPLKTSSETMEKLSGLNTLYERKTTLSVTLLSKLKKQGYLVNQACPFLNTGLLKIQGQSL